MQVRFLPIHLTLIGEFSPVGNRKREDMGMKVGDKVSWKSRAYEPEKAGEIVAIIPAGCAASPYIPKTAKASHIKVGSERSIHNRVLVAVSAGKDNQLTHYYAPTEKVITEQNKQE